MTWCLYEIIHYFNTIYAALNGVDHMQIPLAQIRQYLNEDALGNHRPCCGLDAVSKPRGTCLHSYLWFLPGDRGEDCCPLGLSHGRLAGLRLM